MNNKNKPNEIWKKNYCACQKYYWIIT
jgi:hypothetical protein